MTGPLALLLDFDGTLVPIAPTPDAVVVPDSLRALMIDLLGALEGRVALVSGRSLEQLDAIWGRCLWKLTVAASHGLELRHDGRRSAPPPPNVFRRLTADIQQVFPPTSGVVVEVKTFGIAIHFRLAPRAGEKVADFVADAAEEFGLVIQPGEKVFELRLPGADKGDAVRAIMQRPPFAVASPLYVGDDCTDIPAIAAARALGGLGIAVGARIADHADRVLPSPEAVVERLRALARGDAQAFMT